MSAVFDPLLNLSGLAAYMIIGLLAFGEAAAFVGLFLPGEVAVLLGGVLASTGRVSLPVMLAVAIVAAIAGDSAGYEIGRVFGRRLLRRPAFERRLGDKVDRATTYLAEKGGRAIFLGRWTSVLRALVPGLAGMVKMPYRQFLLFNVLGGIAWGSTFVLAGYLAGESWRRVEAVAGQASLILLALIAVAFVLRWATRRISANEAGVRRVLRAVGGWAPIAWFTRRFSSQLRWLAARLTPGAARGLGWTVSALLSGAAAWVFGVAVRDLLGREELALLDAPVARWIATHTTPALSTTADAIVTVFSPPAAVWIVIAAGIVAWRMNGRSAGDRLVLAIALSIVIAEGLRILLPATLTGVRFPSLAVTGTAAAVAGVAAVVAGHGWRLGATVAGTGAMLVSIVAVADMVTGHAALSGVIGGAGLGTLLVVLVEFTWRTLQPGQGSPAETADAGAPRQEA